MSGCSACDGGGEGARFGEPRYQFEKLITMSTLVRYTPSVELNDFPRTTRDSLTFFSFHMRRRAYIIISQGRGRYIESSVKFVKEKGAIPTVRNIVELSQFFSDNKILRRVRSETVGREKGENIFESRYQSVSDGEKLFVLNCVYSGTE